MLLFLCWGIVNLSPNPQTRGVPLISCPRLRTQYICGCPPYVVAISSVCNPRMCHAMWQEAHLTWCKCVCACVCVVQETKTETVFLHSQWFILNKVYQNLVVVNRNGILLWYLVYDRHMLIFLCRLSPKCVSSVKEAIIRHNYVIVQWYVVNEGIMWLLWIHATTVLIAMHNVNLCDKDPWL